MQTNLGQKVRWMQKRIQENFTGYDEMLRWVPNGIIILKPFTSAGHVSILFNVYNDQKNYMQWDILKPASR